MRKVRSETGLTARKIRHYEAKGLLGEVERNDGNQRIYSQQQIAQLEEIRDYRALGFSLEQIGALLDPSTTPVVLEEWAARLEGEGRQMFDRALLFRRAANERRPAAL